MYSLPLCNFNFIGFVDRTFKIGCPALVYIKAVNKSTLRIEKFVSTHENHDCTVEETSVIPECRRVHENDEGTVGTLFDANVRPATIRMILRDTMSGRLTSRDIANLK